MKKLIIIPLLLTLLNACTSSSGLLNPVPFVDSPETSTNVVIHRAIPHDAFFDTVIFTIDGIDTFGFNQEDDFKFVLREGDYLFGYKYGFFENHCSVDVSIQAGMNYVFSLEPDCVIEME